VHNIETSLCFIIQEDQNNDILKRLSQYCKKYKKEEEQYFTLRQHYLIEM